MFLQLLNGNYQPLIEEHSLKEKQFLYQLLLAEENPEAAIANFRECLSRVNSVENYNMLARSGFNVITRDENRVIEDTAKIVEQYIRL